MENDRVMPHCKIKNSSQIEQMRKGHLAIWNMNDKSYICSSGNGDVEKNGNKTYFTTLIKK